MTTLEGVDPQMIANNLKPFQPFDADVINSRLAGG